MNFGLQVPAWRGVVASTRATWAWPRRACRASDGTLSIRIRTIDRRSTSSPRCKTPRTFAATPAAKSRSPGATPPTRSLDGSTATYPNAAVAMSKCLSYPWRRLSRRRSSSFSPASASSPYWSSSSSSSSVSGPSSTSRAIIYRHRRQVQVQVQVQVLASLSAIYRSTWKLIFKYKSTFKSCPTFEFVLVFFFSILQKQSIEIDLHKLRENSAYHCVASQLNPCLEKLEYPRNDIIYVKDLGHGAFGRVFQASPHLPN